MSINETDLRRDFARNDFLGKCDASGISEIRQVKTFLKHQYLGLSPLGTLPTAIQHKKCFLLKMKIYFLFYQAKRPCKIVLTKNI